MPVQQLVNDLSDGTQEIQIGNTQAISTPIYSPEISGLEDLKAILDHLHALEENNPIIVPGYRWRQLRESVMSGERENELKELIASFPLLMFEPPELFRFSKGGKLATYAFKGSRSQKTDFNSHLKNLEPDEALSMLPSFFREFARAQLSKLYKSAVVGATTGPDRAREVAAPQEIQEAELNLEVAEVWQYRIDDSALNDYFMSLIQDALSFDQADISIIPPVPPLRRSDDDVVAQVFDVNESMLYLCDRFSSTSQNSVSPYLHLYLDSGVIADDSTVSEEIIDSLHERLQPQFAGLSLTLSGYSDIWKNGRDKQLEEFINRVNNICEENYIPFVCPRSEYYGAYLSDLSVNVFSSMLRKHQEYYDQMGAPSPVDRYSRVPDIENGQFMDILEVDKRLSENGELAEYPGLKSRPDGYPPYDTGPLQDTLVDGEEYEQIKDRFGVGRTVRRTFVKPRWLGFVEFARRLRDGRRQGQLSPGKHHLNGTEHPHLS